MMIGHQDAWPPGRRTFLGLLAAAAVPAAALMVPGAAHAQSAGPGGLPDYLPVLYTHSHADHIGAAVLFGRRVELLAFLNRSRGPHLNR